MVHCRLRMVLVLLSGAGLIRERTLEAAGLSM
jgi:hypothetical protein